jgi:dolichol kinase
MQLDFIRGFGILFGYFAISASCALALRRFTAVPAEIFRKTLHIILLVSIFIWTYGFRAWWISAAAAVVFILIVFPILSFAERIPGYSKLLTERKHGEIKRSLIVVFVMFTVLICVCWGWLGQRYLVIAAVLAWGLGDAAAALVGKYYGQHYIEGKLVEGRKSVEGTFAMFVTSFISVLVVLLVHGSLIWYGCIPIALLTAAVCAVVELYTKGGMDTLTCPFAAAVVMIPLIYLMGGLIL